MSAGLTHTRACAHTRSYRSHREGQHCHHPVPQADQLPQLAFLLPAVAALRQQAGHVNQDTEAKEHGLDHLGGESEV